MLILRKDYQLTHDLIKTVFFGRYSQNWKALLWINHGWCDNNCQNLDLCGYAGDDCKKNNGCLENSKCDDVYELFEFAANVLTKNNKISQEELCIIWKFIKI